MIRISPKQSRLTHPIDARCILDICVVRPRTPHKLRSLALAKWLDVYSMFVCMSVREIDLGGPIMTELLNFSLLSSERCITVYRPPAHTSLPLIGSRSTRSRGRDLRRLNLQVVSLSLASFYLYLSV